MMRAIPFSSLTLVCGGHKEFQLEGSAATNKITSSIVVEEKINPFVTISAKGNASTSGERDWTASISVSF